MIIDNTKISIIFTFLFQIFQSARSNSTMVLFINVNVGQDVEVYYQGGIEKGVVKYKGGLANTQGDWVGVQLDRPGMWKVVYLGCGWAGCVCRGVSTVT